MISTPDRLLPGLRIWQPNSSDASPVMTRGSHHDIQSGGRSTRANVLSTSHSRTAAAERFVASRRRLTMGLDLRLETDRAARRQLASQLWSRVYDAQVRGRLIEGQCNNIYNSPFD